LLEFIDPRSKLAYEARKGGVEKRFTEILGAIRNHLDQLRAYIMKSNSDIERRSRDNRTSLTRKGQSTLVSKMEEESQLKMQQRCQAFDSLVKLSEIQFIESAVGLLQNNTLESRAVRLECKFLKKEGAEYELTCSPLVSERLRGAKKASEDAENLILNNRKIVEFLGKLQQLPFASPKSNLSDKVFDSIHKRLGSREFPTAKALMLRRLQEDLEQADAFLQQFEDLKQVVSFAYSADHQNECKQTLLLMQKFQTLAEQIPAFPVRFRDVQLDCLALREQVLAVP